MLAQAGKHEGREYALAGGAVLSSGKRIPVTEQNRLRLLRFFNLISLVCLS
jgi:hypothetical protein